MLRSLTAFAGIGSFLNNDKQTSGRLESVWKLPYSMSWVLSGFIRRRLSRHQLRILRISLLISETDFAQSWIGKKI